MGSKICSGVLLCVFLVTASANPFFGGQGNSNVTQNKIPSLTAPSVRVGPVDPELVARQRTVRDRLADALSAWETAASGNLLWTIVTVSFLYGLLHAAGPGHRKTIVFSLYLARRSPVWEPALMGLVLSLLHGGAAVVLILIFQGVSGAISARVDFVGRYMEGSAYLLLLVTSVFLLVRAVNALFFQGGTKEKGLLDIGAILVSGLYPCPGAVLVLVLCITRGIVGIGVAAVLAMSLGMSLPIIGSGYLAWFGRTGVFQLLKQRESVFARVSSFVEIAGYLFMFLFSLYLSIPFITALTQ